MNAISNTPNSDLPASNSGAVSTAPFIWSAKRELWENRWIYIAPLIVALVELLGFMVSTIGMASRRRAVLLLDPAQQRAVISISYDAAAVMLLLTAFIVGLFYCLDALYGERRERSILFWKSLPVSDRTTVFSKTFIPLVVLPLIIFAIIVVTQFVMLLISSIVLFPSGLAGTTWSRFNLLQQSVVLFYSVIVVALWHAPIYGWALLISGWVRRAPFLWAVMPFLAISIFEKITFNTSYFFSMVRQRVFGAGDTAFDFRTQHISIDSLSQLTPGRFFTTPGLWVGLIFAAAFIIAAIRMRRYRGPL